MNPNISLPQLPTNLDPALRDYLFAWQKLITQKQLDDYSANKSVDTRLAQIENMYGIGAIYISINNVNPSTWMTGTTWVAFGKGRTLVGVDTAQTEFDTVEETGGEKTHTLTLNEMPSHDHYQQGISSPGSQAFKIASGTTYGLYSETEDKVKTEAVGGGSGHNNLQPYITVYMWKRTA